MARKMACKQIDPRQQLRGPPPQARRSNNLNVAHNDFGGIIIKDSQWLLHQKFFSLHRRELFICLKEPPSWNMSLGSIFIVSSSHNCHCENKNVSAYKYNRCWRFNARWRFLQSSVIIRWFAGHEYALLFQSTCKSYFSFTIFISNTFCLDTKLYCCNHSTLTNEILSAIIVFEIHFNK